MFSKLTEPVEKLAVHKGEGFEGYASSNSLFC